MPPDPTKPGGFAIDPNHLHIWPRHAFMLIALPNKDGSFTLTLFIPFSALKELDTREAATRFFNEHFPTAVEHAGEKRIVDDFMNNPRGNLVMTHVSGPHPYNNERRPMSVLLCGRQIVMTDQDRYCRLPGRHMPSFSATQATAWSRTYPLCPHTNHFLPKSPTDPLAPYTSAYWSISNARVADNISFYGQGLNCGLEDVRVFNAYLEKHKISSTTSLPLGETDDALEAALSDYSADRDEDLKAILELAMQN